MPNNPQPVGTPEPMEKRTVVVEEVSSVSETPEVPKAPEPGMEPAPVKPKKKKSNAALLGIILLTIIAAAGAGFGVWALMEGSTQQEQLKSQISSLQSENNELQAQINKLSDDGEVVVDVETDGYENPVIKSNDPEAVYRVGFKSSYYYDGNNQYYMMIDLKDGAVEACSIYMVDGSFNSNCAITGINGEVFKIAEFGEGQDNSNSNIGFIMTDGSVQYFPFIEAMKNKDFSIKGQLSVNGFVADIIDITVGASASDVVGGYGSTVFILNDGSFVKFDKEMLE